MSKIKDYALTLLNNLLSKLHFNIQNLITAILLAIILLIIYKRVDSIFTKHKNKIPLDKSIQKMLRTVIKIIYLFFSCMIIANILGINTTSFIAAFSVIGIAISLAIQNVMSNVANAGSIFISKPFQENDYIKTGDIEGTVVEISFMNTKILTPNNEVVYIPNTKIGQQIITNYSQQTLRRIMHTVLVSYNSPVNLVKKTMTDAILSEKNVVKDQDVIISIEELADNGIVYSAKFWTYNNTYFETKSNTLENIKKFFDIQKIEIPYNQIDVLLKQQN